MAEKKNENTTLVNFRIDPVVKESAEAVLAGMGLNVSAFVGMCLRQLAQDRELPFTPTVNADFWMAENAVADAMKYIDGGLFARACKCKDMMEVKYTAKVFENREINQWYLIALAADTTLVGTYRKLNTVKDMADKEDGVEELYALVDSLKSLIADDCAAFLKENGIFEEGMDDMGVVEAFDEIRFTPLSVYERYPSNFALRFASTGADVDSYQKVVELHEWVQKCEKDSEKRSADEAAKQRELFAALAPMLAGKSE